MLRHISIIALSVALATYALSSCRHEPFNPETGNFPADVSRIMISKCATTGCHDAAGAVNAAKLRLDSWGELFKGSSHGAVVVPYAPKFSSLLYYLNHSDFSNNDIVSEPAMPYNQPPLTEDEYNIIKNWIANGAPDADGNIAFAGEADTRQKVYISQQGCDDLITVIDSKTGLVMRYIPIGGDGSKVEVAHNVKFSRDGKYAYVCFYQGGVVQKIDAREDRVVGTVSIGDGNWNVINVSPDGNRVIVSGTANGAVVVINSASMSIVDNFSGIFTQPHGLAATRNFDTLYITSQYGNVIYRYVLNSFELEPITINEGPETFSSATGTPDPHEVLMTPDYSKMFITCQNNKEVKVMNMATEQIIATIPVGAVPKEIAISKKRGLAFITCMEDPENLYSGKSRGSVYVIDINTLQKVGNPIYGDFYQPHGIVVDEQNDLVYIASTNTNPNGPAPHHSSSCNGRNGWYSIYDLNTLQPFNNIRYETTPDPYGADVRFK